MLKVYLEIVTSVKGQRDMKPRPGMEGSLWPCEYTLVRDFGCLLTVTPVNEEWNICKPCTGKDLFTRAHEVEG